MNIRNRHNNVVPTMAQGVLEYKEAFGVDPVTNQNVQYFLDRFYMSRISIRMLMNQHSQYSSTRRHASPLCVWSGQPRVSRALAAGARSERRLNPLHSVPLALIFDGSVNPAHPKHIGSIDPTCDVVEVVKGNE